MTVKYIDKYNIVPCLQHGHSMKKVLTDSPSTTAQLFDCYNVGRGKFIECITPRPRQRPPNSTCNGMIIIITLIIIIIIIIIITIIII